MKIYSFLTTTGLLLLLACNPFIKERGNGNITSEKWELNDFTKVELSGSYDVELIKGEESSVTIETDENLFDFIKVEESGHYLVIETDGRIKATDGIRIYITYNEINGIYMGGAARITTNETLETDYLEVDMAGAGDVELAIIAKELTIDISGAGAVRLSGEVIDLEVGMSGAGDLEAHELRTRYCKVRISGVGNADIFVTDELEASVSGLGRVTYFGNPDYVNSDVSGLGKISPGDDNVNM